MEKGQIRLGRSPECHLRLFRRKLPTLSHQHRQFSRLHRHNFPHRRSHPLLLSHIHFLHFTQTVAGRSSLSQTMQLGSYAQCHCYNLPQLGLLLYILAATYACHC